MKNETISGMKTNETPTFFYIQNAGIRLDI
jgi:hypothetical protein